MRKSQLAPSTALQTTQAAALPFDSQILAGQLAPSSMAMYQRDFQAYLRFAGSADAALDAATLARWRAHLAQEPVGGRPQWSVLKFAALYHDVGKPATRSVDAQGVVHFYGHEVVGAAMVERAARDLRLGVREIVYLKQVVRYHLRPLFLATQKAVSARSEYRYFRDTGDAAADILLLSLADNRGKTDDADSPASADTVLITVVRLLDLLYAEEPPPVVAPPRKY